MTRTSGAPKGEAKARDLRARILALQRTGAAPRGRVHGHPPHLLFSCEIDFNVSFWHGYHLPRRHSHRSRAASFARPRGDGPPLGASEAVVAIAVATPPPPPPPTPPPRRSKRCGARRKTGDASPPRGEAWPRPRSRPNPSKVPKVSAARGHRDPASLPTPRLPPPLPSPPQRRSSRHGQRRPGRGQPSDEVCLFERREATGTRWRRPTRTMSSGARV